MGDDRNSSGSGTMLIVVAILGGILVAGCCGGAVVFGLGGVMFWAREASPPAAVPVMVQDAATNAPDPLQALDPLKVNPEEMAEPGDPTLREVPERAPGVGDTNSATAPEDSGSTGSLEKKE